MRVRFNGGPWDGVEFDAPICPDVIHFRDMDVRMGPVEGRPLEFTVEAAKREHHQYAFNGPRLREGIELAVGVNLSREPEEGEDPLGLADEVALVMHYRYAPGEPAWWEE